MGLFGRRQQEPEPPPTPERERERQPAPAAPIQQAPPASAPQPIGFETVLGSSSTLEGALVSNSNVRLDGMFTGTLQINGNVLIGETAKITADLNARNISIAGAIRGNVTGKKVQILRTGRVWGDITADALATEEGAFIDGKISMVNEQAPTATAEVGGDAPVTLPPDDDAPTEPPVEPDFLDEPEPALSHPESAASTADFAFDDRETPYDHDARG
jgi:cytoskeletal protein CcmA (bactofilin family)